MRILYFTKYEDLGASSRLRSYQFFPYLNNLGYEIKYQALFKNKYVKNLYLKKSNIYNLICSYLERFFFLITILFKFRKFDLIVIEKELFPYTPILFEYLFYLLNISYVVDYDDAIFHNYDMHKNKIIRYALGNKIDKVMFYSNHVFAGNEYLLERARNSNAKSSSFLPTVIDLNLYNLKTSYPKNEFILGWIGSPSTVRYLEELFPVFEKIHKKYPNFKVNAIGAKSDYIEYSFINSIEWKKETEVEEINKFSIGIMPLYDAPFEKGKCSYKLIQYMGCYKPCIASPIGSNNQVITEGFNGKFASNEKEWYDGIEYFILNPNVIKDFGMNGRKRIDEIYNINSNIQLMNIIFKRINDNRK